MKNVGGFLLSGVATLGGALFVVACGGPTTFGGAKVTPAKPVAAANKDVGESKKQNGAIAEGDAGATTKLPSILQASPTPKPAPETVEQVVSSVESPAPQAVATVLPDPTPDVISQVKGVESPTPAPAPAPDVCAVNLTERFGGFSLKGGTSAPVSDTFAAYPGKKAEFTFPPASKLSYSNGYLRAASAVGAEAEVSFEVKIPGAPACEATLKAKLLPDDAFVTASAQERGLKGKLYALVKDQPRLPNFSELTASGDVYISSVDVPKRSFLQGFPGVDANLTEWFAIDFTGLILIETAGDYQFRVSSDDGSRLYLNGTEIIDNDGQHGDRAVDSAEVRLEPGAFPLRLSYFQGPKDSIALRLFYKGPGVSEWTIVPQSMLRVSP